jgi:hypothetical protein
MSQIAGAGPDDEDSIPGGEQAPEAGQDNQSDAGQDAGSDAAAAGAEQA